MDRRVALYYSTNGTLQILPGDPPFSVASLVITLICFLFGVAYNFIVASAIYSNRKLRSSPFHQVLALVSVACLLDSLTNESVAFGILLNNRTSWCTFSAAVFLCFLLLHAAAGALLGLEGTMALRQHPLSLRVCRVAVLSAWGFALGLTLPTLLAGEVHYFPNRMACAVVLRSSWLAIFLFISIMVCWLNLATFSISSVQKLVKDRNQQTALSLFPVASISMRNQVSDLPLVNNIKTNITSTILLLHVVLMLPLTLSVFVYFFFDPPYEPDPWLDPRKPGYQIRSILTHALEPLLTFLRYMYDVVVPIFVLSADSSVRLQSRKIFCCKRNAVSHEDSTFKRIERLPQVDLEPKESAGDFKTPVLFATPRGLYLRVASITNPGSASTSGNSLRLVSKFCDLTSETHKEIQRPQFIDEEEGKGAGDVKERCGYKRNVRFSSKVDAISPLANTKEGMTSDSDTRIVLNPVYVKSEASWSENAGKTYDKIL